MKISAIKKYKHIIFSPHLDDAVLSCGGLIQKFPQNVLVINIFTHQGASSGSRYAKKYLEFCGFKNAALYYAYRKYEENSVAQYLEYGHISLNYPEALFRFKKILIFKNFLYRSKNKLFGKVHSHDLGLTNNIRDKVFALLKKYSSASSRYYFPLGIGNNVDHQIVSSLAESLTLRKRVIYYEDFPYTVWQRHTSPVGYLKPTRIKLNRNMLAKKHQAILMYHSQVKPLFSGLVNLEKIWKKVKNNPYEIYWH